MVVTRLPTLQASPTKRGLLPEARHLILPDGITASGFPSVEATCRSIGIEFDPWQRDLNKCLLAKGADGLYAADTAVVSIPRQVGKTFDIGAVVFALCIKNPGMTVVWTAHRFKVSRETFNELRGLAKSPKLVPHLDYDDITTAAGNECIPFRNGSRIVFAARERGAIRGFTKVAILILDEAQILTHSVLADLAPTMNQAANPLIIMMGTPPKPTDPGEVFADLRAAALEGSSDELLYVELSAPAGSDPDDRDALKVANPSYPHRTPDRAIRRLRRLLTVDDFLREVFGIWDTSAGSRLDFTNWAELADTASEPAGAVTYGVAVSLDRDWSAISLAGTRPDGLKHVDTGHHRRGTGWVVDACVEIDQREPGSLFIVDGGGPAGSLIPELKAAGLSVETAGLRDVAQAHGIFMDSVRDKDLRHRDQAELNDAKDSARPRMSGDGLILLGRKASGADITPLESAELALWGHINFESGAPNIW